MIVAFGNPVYDYIKTPVVTTGERVLSGCSTNGCLALARLGHATAVLTKPADASTLLCAIRDGIAQKKRAPRLSK